MGSDFLMVQIRLHCSALSEVTTNCFSGGSHHFPALRPDCKQLISLPLTGRYLCAGPASRERGHSGSRPPAPCTPLLFAPREFTALSEPLGRGIGGCLARVESPSHTLGSGGWVRLANWPRVTWGWTRTPSLTPARVGCDPPGRWGEAGSLRLGGCGGVPLHKGTRQLFLGTS